MASDLITKIKKLKNEIIKRSNAEFKKNAVEIINPNKVDEDMYIMPSEYPSGVVDEEPQNAEAPVPNPEEPKAEEHEAPDLKALMKVESMLRKSIAEEQEAAAVYIERAQKCIEHEDFKLAALFEELAGDEIVHAASLETALDMYNMFDPYKFLQGQAEAEYLLQESTEDIAKKEQKARDDADKARKEFDFVGEYTRDKAEYEKEKIVNVINDLILGKTAVDDVIDVVMKSAKSAKKDKKKDKKAE